MLILLQKNEQPSRVMLQKTTQGLNAYIQHEALEPRGSPKAKSSIIQNIHIFYFRSGSFQAF